MNPTDISDGAKLGLIAGALGLTGLTAWCLREGGFLNKDKTAKGNFAGPGYGPTFPIGSSEWAAWQAQHTASGGGPGYGPNGPIGSAQWAAYQASQNPDSYAPPTHGAPGHGVHPAEAGYHPDHHAAGATPDYPIGGEAWAGYQAEHTAAGPSSYTARADRETPQSIADKFGVTTIRVGRRLLPARTRP